MTYLIASILWGLLALVQMIEGDPWKESMILAMVFMVIYETYEIKKRLP